MRHNINELREMQALPLYLKIAMTRDRIRAWIKEYGINGVYVSFSGGKDSTVLLDIVRKDYPECKAMFVDVPTQFPELRQFVKKFDNVDIVKPKLNFIQVCEKYGFPLFNKEVCENINGAKKYWKQLKEEGFDVYDREFLSCVMNERMLSRSGGSNQRLAIVLGMLTRDKKNPIKANLSHGEKSKFSLDGYKFLLDAPFDISNKCCSVMKKEPAASYSKKENRVPITAQMADESRLRLQVWFRHGCNAFDSKNPMSNPMSFWTEQDVLQYIVKNSLEICSVYGDVVNAPDQKNELRCTGCSRTGCSLCGFGTHMQGNDRFIKLKESHPGMYGLLDIAKNNGMSMRQAIDWVNENSDKHIEY